MISTKERLYDGIKKKFFWGGGDGEKINCVTGKRKFCAGAD